MVQEHVKSKSTPKGDWGSLKNTYETHILTICTFFDVCFDIWPEMGPGGRGVGGEGKPSPLQRGLELRPKGRRILGLGYEVLSLGCGVKGLGYEVLGLGCGLLRLASNAGARNVAIYEVWGVPGPETA